MNMMHIYCVMLLIEDEQPAASVLSLLRAIPNVLIRFYVGVSMVLGTIVTS